MARSQGAAVDLDAIKARREQLMQELAVLQQKEKAAQLAARDAGRAVLLTALDRVKVPAMSKADAKLIAEALASRGGEAVALALGNLPA